MKGIETFLLSYLLNALWQIPLVYLAALGTIRLARTIDVQLEHRVWVTALFVELILPACSLPSSVDVLRVRDLLLGASVGGSQSGVRVEIGAEAVRTASGVHIPNALRIVLLALYAGSIVYFALRIVWGYLQARSLRRGAHAVSMATEGLERWQLIGELCGIEASSMPAIRLSDAINGPITVGIRRPVLLLPEGFVADVVNGKSDALLAHELAHVQRRDVAKNLFYSVVSIPVALHPCVWMTRSRLSESREMVCDAFAAEVVSGRDEYARALVRLASKLAPALGPRVLHAIGILESGVFERRIMRLKAKKMETSGVRKLATITACAAIALTACVSAMAVRVPVDDAASSKSAGTHSGPVTVAPGVMQGLILEKEPPKYPEEAKVRRIQGKVVLSAIIGKDGSVKELKATSGPKELQQSALDAVRTWKYKPYLLNGNPVDVKTAINVIYSLSQ